MTIVTNIAMAIWIPAVLLQVLDIVTGQQVRRAGRTAGLSERSRILAWVNSLGAIGLVGLIVGVHAAMQLWSTHPLLCVLALAGLAAAAALIATLFSRILRAPNLEYTPLLKELRRSTGQRLSTGRLRDLRAWLEAIDGRQPKLSRQVVLGRVLRSLPLVLAVAAFAGAMVMAVQGELEWPHALLVALTPLLSGVLALLGSRLALTRSLAVHAVRQKHRVEAVERLEELERRAPAKVAGLSDRVARALSILREQQGQEHKR